MNIATYGLHSRIASAVQELMLAMKKLCDKELNFHASLIRIFTKYIKPKNFLNPTIIIIQWKFERQMI